MTDRLQEIKERAEAAAGVTGSLTWEVVDGNEVSAIECSPRDGSVIGGGPVASTSAPVFAEYIVSMNPDTALELIDRVEKAESEVERLRAENQRLKEENIDLSWAVSPDRQGGAW